MGEIWFFDGAELDVADARDWYETEELGQGERFVSELEHQLMQIGAAPKDFPIGSLGLRRAGLRFFPFSIFFHVRGDIVYVIACFYAHQKAVSFSPG